MHRKRNWLLVLIPLIAALPSFADVKSDATVDGVTAVLKSQTEAWNRGDLDAFMQGYLNSPKTSYVSGGKKVTSYDALRENYQKKYGNNPESMGKLTMSDLDITPLGRDHALCVGHWHLECANQPALGGIYSLVFSKEHGKWKVIHDHTSLDAPAPTK